MGVRVGVSVGVDVGVSVGVSVGVEVGVSVAVGVGSLISAIFATNASLPPLKVRSGPTSAGNVASLEVVDPVTYALPDESTAMAKPMSDPAPPM